MSQVDPIRQAHAESIVLKVLRQQRPGPIVGELCPDCSGWAFYVPQPGGYAICPYCGNDWPATVPSPG